MDNLKAKVLFVRGSCWTTNARATAPDDRLQAKPHNQNAICPNCPPRLRIWHVCETLTTMANLSGPSIISGDGLNLRHLDCLSRHRFSRSNTKTYRLWHRQHWVVFA